MRMKKPITWNPNKARDERKREVLGLRQEVVDLETQLRVLQEMKPQRVCQIAHGQQQCNSAANECAWKEVVRCQSDERITSERENLHLRHALDN
uniref:Uncharacterized protein n=1 Tax=Globisporangium ultimum (strain ATCC 200006 / CBS 805.95 / DAOM BR144) TaxID=431595 RepID=K3W8T6_GLOUD